MGAISEDIRRLLEDCELFVSDILQDESLSEHARETRDILLNNFRVVHNRNPQEFPVELEPRQEDSSDDNRSNSLGRSAPSDDASLASDCQDEGALHFFGEIAAVAAQDLNNILKQGYLEKKRRDHSFFSMEWQKRWCVLNNTIFYYFGSEKDRQQKGSFYINGYSVELVTNLRKDSKKNACFELSAPGRRNFQFTASSPREAREWVDQINFVLKDLSSSFIPYDDEDEEEEEEEEGGEQRQGGEEEEEETYDDIEEFSSPPPPPLQQQQQPRPGLGLHHPHPVPGPRQGPDDERSRGDDEEDEDDIYEVLPDDDFPEEEESGEKSSKSDSSSDYANYYQGLWDCEGDEPDELSFQRGELVYILSKEYNIHGWWVGEISGTVGIVPKDFLHPAYIL